MRSMDFMLVLRHRRVLPRLFMLLERLGADCRHFQFTQHSASGGGRLRLTVECPPMLAHRVRTQIERLVDVTETLELHGEETAHFYAAEQAA